MRLNQLSYQNDEAVSRDHSQLSMGSMITDYDRPTASPVYEGFKSSTALRTVEVQQRHQDMFTGKQYTVPRKKVMVLHTARYLTDGLIGPDDSPSPDGTASFLLSGTGSQHKHISDQRQRLQNTTATIDRVKLLKRKLEGAQHRRPRNFFVGGRQLDINQRFSIQHELHNLKAMVMPEQARWLFHGKGISLHKAHQSVKPVKKLMIEDPPDPVWHGFRGPTATGNKNKSTRRGVNLARTPSVGGGLDRAVSPPASLQGTSIRSGRSSGLLSGRSSARGSIPPPSPMTLPSTPGLQSRPLQYVRSMPDLTSSMQQAIVSIPLAPTTQPSESPLAFRPPLPSPKFVEENRATPHPLKVDLEMLVSENTAEQLTQQFKRLDTDRDGHVRFNQLTNSLPKDLTQHQKKYIKQVYDIVESTTFFGVKEFISISYLSQRISNLSDEAFTAYQQLNFSLLEEAILSSVELFQRVDKHNTGRIDYVALRAVLSGIYELELTETHSTWLEIRSVIRQNAHSDQLKKLDFLALMPYFLAKNPNV